MSEEKELLEDLKGIIFDCLNDEWHNAIDVNDFKVKRDYEAYGDTYVSTGDYITEESETKFREGFKQDITPEEFIEKLKVYPDFMATLKKLIAKHADTANLC